MVWSCTFRTRMWSLSRSLKLGDIRTRSGCPSRSYSLQYRLAVQYSTVCVGEMSGSGRAVKQPPGGDCHDLFGAEFKGSPCHHRVLKPPGGGSSDIFGMSEAVEQSPRRVHMNHHLQSSMFGANGMPESPSVRRTKPGNDSYSRLFGPVECRPQSTPVNRMKSNLPIGMTGGGSDQQPSGNSTAAKSGAIENGQQAMLSTPAGGNPVTGEGHIATAINDQKGSSSPPAVTTTNGTGNAEVRRNRVPPGGFSSGLW